MSPLWYKEYVRVELLEGCFPREHFAKYILNNAVWCYSWFQKWKISAATQNALNA